MTLAQDKARKRNWNIMRLRAMYHSIRTMNFFFVELGPYDHVENIMNSIDALLTQMGATPEGVRALERQRALMIDAAS